MELAGGEFGVGFRGVYSAFGHIMCDIWDCQDRVAFGVLSRGPREKFLNERKVRFSLVRLMMNILAWETRLYKCGMG